MHRPHPLHLLHDHARRLARWVLWCFVLATGVAVASPLVAPSSTQMICSATAPMKWVQLDADSQPKGEALASTLECPLCLAALIAPPPAVTPAEFALPQGTGLLPLASDAPVLAPRPTGLHVRGPPAVS